MNPKVKPNWRAVFDQFRNSGLSKADFCRTHKISLSSFSYYSKLHSQEQQLLPVLQSSSSFISVRDKQEFRLKINDSLTLSFDSLPDATWPSNFVKSLGGANARS
jgi:hypothetical protein